MRLRHAILLAFVVVASPAHPQTPPAADPPMITLGPVLRMAPAAAGAAAAPGATRHLFRADRGSRKGQEMLVRVEEATGADRTTRPSPPAGEAEYHLVGQDARAGWPVVDVLGMHYVQVQPARQAAFEQFVRERLHPAVARLRPDLSVLYYRAAHAGPSNYVALFALTRASRDRYWPGGSDSDALREAFKPLQPLAAELRTYLVDGSYLADPKFAAAIFESRDWSDFVLVSRSR
jgi:hypothetical protein